MLLFFFGISYVISTTFIVQMPYMILKFSIQSTCCVIFLLVGKCHLQSSKVLHCQVLVVIHCLHTGTKPMVMVFETNCDSFVVTPWTDVLDLAMLGLSVEVFLVSLALYTYEYYSLPFPIQNTWINKNMFLYIL